MALGITLLYIAQKTTPMETRYTFRFYLVLAGFGLLSALHAQNLVPNASFDVQDTCPTPGDIEFASPWNSPTRGTPDLFNGTCSTQNPPGHTGIGSAGLYFYYDVLPNYREYLQVPLTQSLAAGQMYHVSFWVTRTDFKYAVSTFGAYFSTSEMSVNNTGVLPQTPQILNPSSNAIIGTAWNRISGNFVASGGESHLIIGSFSNDAATSLVTANATNATGAAYYRIDDVSVTSTQVGIEEFGSKELTWGTSASGDRVWVSVPGALESSQPFSLYDMGGRTVPFTTERSGADRYDIIPATPATGLYLLRVQSGSDTRVAKVSFQPPY